MILINQNNTREPLSECFKRRGHFHTRQFETNVAMDAGSERQMCYLVGSLNIKSIGIAETNFISDRSIVANPSIMNAVLSQ